MKRAATLIAVLAFAPFLIGMAVALTVAGNFDSEQAQAAGCPTVTVTGVGPVTGLDADQARNAATLTAVAARLDVPAEGAVVAVAAAFVESGVRVLASRAYPESLNYPHDGVADGDADSVGLMQQRPPWGTMRDRMDPATSARMFYTGGSRAGDGYSEPGLLDVDGWQAMSVAEAAQAVQVSAYPDAYAEYAAAAEQVVTDLTGSDLTVTGGCPDDSVAVSGRWTQPLEVGTYTYNADSFGACGALWAACHTGVDLSGAAVAAPIYAAASGTVTTAGWAGGDSYGWLVVIDHGGRRGDVETYYAHQVRRPVVRVGDEVAAGDVVGHLGSTGKSTGPHLHFETRIGGEPVDPVPFMADHNAPL